MDLKLNKNSIAAGGIVITLVSLSIILTFCVARNEESSESNRQSAIASSQASNQPIIIWYQDPWRDPNIVQLVLKNGIFTHVMLVGLHKFDNPPYHTKPFVKETIRLCKEKGVKVIWTRWLYPGYQFERFDNQDAFEAMYYVQQIRLLRQEAQQIGADFIAFDAEPNANATMKAFKRSGLSKNDFERMKDAIKKAVAIEGQVDFILPEGKDYRNHMYNATRQLGKYVVAEHTYYDRPLSIGYTKIPYDIFGAYISVRKGNEAHPQLPFFTPREILEKQYLWGHKKGLFIYPGDRKNALAIASEFSKITSIQPVQDINDVR